MGQQSKVSKKIFFVSLFLIGAANVFADNPSNMIVVDTGYDLCMQEQGSQCEKNKNILIRGSQPLNHQNQFNREDFQQKTLSAITDFHQRYDSKAAIATSLDELKNYRIVMINLLYGYVPASGGKKKEGIELRQEFALSGVSANQAMPDQHRAYGLNTPFKTTQYAFEWWPITLLGQGLFDPAYTTSTLNWPDMERTPIHDYLPTRYLPMDLPFLIQNELYSKKVVEPTSSMSLPNLLKSIPADGHPLLIYYHCVAGKDRTGLVSIAYYMSQGGYPFLANAPLKKMTRSKPMKLDQAKEAALSMSGKANNRAQQLAKMYSNYLGKKIFCYL